jgi:hypothetical protein
MNKNLFETLLSLQCYVDYKQIKPEVVLDDIKWIWNEICKRDDKIAELNVVIDGLEDRLDYLEGKYELFI